MRLLLIKHGIYELPHELLNNLKNIMKLGNCPNSIESQLTTQPSTPTKTKPSPPKRKGHKNVPPQSNRTAPAPQWPTKHRDQTDRPRRMPRKKKPPRDIVSAPPEENPTIPPPPRPTPKPRFTPHTAQYR